MAGQGKAMPRNKLVVTKNPVFRMFVRLGIGKYLVICLLILAASTTYAIRHAALSSQNASTYNPPAKSTQSTNSSSAKSSYSSSILPSPAAQNSANASAPAQKGAAINMQGASGVLTPVQQLLNTKLCPVGFLGTEPNCTPILLPKLSL